MHVCVGVCKGKVLRVGLRGSIAFFLTVTTPSFRPLTTHATYKLIIQTIENIRCIEEQVQEKNKLNKWKLVEKKRSSFKERARFIMHLHSQAPKKA